MAATASTSPQASRRRRLIETGELVPNQPLRERFLWLLGHDPEFTRSVCCHRLAALGYPQFVNSLGHGQTSSLDRVLGLRPQYAGRERRRLGLPGNVTTHIPYPLAVALCRALEMDPVDGGV